MNKDLEHLKQDPQFIRNYTIGMKHLQQSAIFPVLRQLGMVHYPPSATPDQVALIGARSAGFQDCINVLFDFLETHIKEKPDGSGVRMDFGGLEYAVKNGYISEKEANGIRNGQYLSEHPSEERGSPAVNINGNASKT